MYTRKNLLIVAVSIIVLLLLYISMYNNTVTKSQTETIIKTEKISERKTETLPINPYDRFYGKAFQAALDRAAKAKKRIAFWHPDGDLSMTANEDLPHECGSCIVRPDKSLIDSDGTHAVIFLCEDMKRSKLPEKRNPNQYWVWRSAEAAPYLALGDWVRYSDNVKFNLTLNYRREADITLHYGSANDLYQNPLPPDMLSRKKHLAFVAISNCGMTPGAKVRLQYINELIRRGFDIATMGGCFSGQKIPKTEFAKMTSHTSEFKFYFSFENAYHCRDYITEKFFRPLQAGTVPVVWGARRKDYETYVPASAFIHIEDFPSMQHLIDHLVYLDKNDAAYLEYFKWRTEYPKPITYRKKEAFCQLCRFINGINVDDAYKVDYDKLPAGESFIFDEPQNRQIPSMYKWFVETEDKDCLAKNLVLDEKGNIVIGK